MLSVADMLSTIPTMSPTSDAAGTVAQATKGTTNASHNVGASGGSTNVYVAGGMVLLALAFVWFGGGVAFKGL